MKKTFILLSLLLSISIFAADGDLDTTYNPSGTDSQAGTKVTNFNASLIAAAEEDIANDVAISTVGGSIKIVMGGTIQNNASLTNFALLRYNEDASPDLSFNNPTGPSTSNKPGTIITAVPNGTVTPTSSVINGVAVQPDGKIVAAGYIESPVDTNNRFIVVARYNFDGSMDTTFSNATAPSSSSPTPGIIITQLGSTAFATDVALQANGKIVVVGATSIGGVQEFFIARYNTDGSLDTTGFNAAGTGSGVPGIAVVDFGNAAAAATAVAIQPNQKIVAVGFDATAISGPFVPTASVFAAARLNTNGTLDTATFNSGGAIPGTQTTAFGVLVDFAEGVALDSNSNIILAGGSTVIAGEVFAVLRYTPLGVLDTSFNGTGKQTTAINLIAAATDVVVQSWDDKIIATGFTVNGLTSNDFAVVRYLTNGPLDPSFGSGGIVTTDFAGLADIGFGSAMQPDRKLVVGGSAAYLLASVDPTFFASARYIADASADIFAVIIDPIDGSSTTNATPPITVSTLPGAEVTIFVDGTEICTTTANSEGFATCFPPEPLAPGNHIATATATLDGASADAEPVSFIVLGGGIFVQELFPLPNSTINTRTPTIFGRTNPGNSVTLTIDGVQINGTVIADSEGNFFITVTTPLSVGIHTKVLTATDGVNTAVEIASFAIDLSQCTSPADALTLAIRQKFNS